MKITDIIKYEGDNTTFIWKHPSEDFNTMTQLIVHQSQEAIFFLNGEALDSFGPGRHTLETQNIPLIRRIMNLPTGGETPFHCEVYFINKTEQMAIKWGTDSKVQFMEPTYQFPIQIGASGEMSLCADNGRALLLKLVGTENALEQAALTTYFRAFLMTRVKAYLVETIQEQKINIFEIDRYLNTLSSDLQKKLAADFIEYGVALKQFFVTTIVKPDGDPPYERFKLLHFRQYADVMEAELQQKVGVIEQQTKTQQTIIEAQGIAQKRQIEGYSYQQERGFDVAEKVAENEGVGEMSNLGIGLGVMAGVSGGIGASVGGVVNNALGSIGAPSAPPQKNAPFCDNCGTKLAEGARFCDECGTQSIPRGQCKDCGFSFERPGKFCPKCGKKREG